MGCFVSERLSIDNYYLVEVIYILISEYGEDNLKKDYPDYIKVMKKLRTMNRYILESKTFYDTISDKNFKSKFKDLDSFQKYLKKQFVKMSSRIAPIQPEIYKLFIFLVKNSDIQFHQIRQEMLKILEYQNNTKIEPSKVKDIQKSP